MKIVFVSNYYNHHQAPFAKEIDRLAHHKFFFIETSPMEDERRKMGWRIEDKPDYVLQSYLDKSSYNRCQKIINDADVVIWGSCPFRMIRPRLRKKKLTFAYSERLFKKRNHGMAYWGRALKYFCRLKLYQKNHYLLCASAYAVGDYAKIGLFYGKALKWGYFPETKTYDLIELFEKKRANMRPVIIWVARFIEWKHPEVAVELADKLKQAGYDFDLNMIGTGELEDQITSMINKKWLDDCVHMLGAMQPEEVRSHMEKANIFLFTSDQNEGWGTVLNEAMNSGCAVIANRSIGAVPFLVEHNVNGLTYGGSQEELQNCMEQLLNQPERCKRLGTAAYQMIEKEWNAKIAAVRLKKLVDQEMVEPKWDNGPVSKA